MIQIIVLIQKNKRHVLHYTRLKSGSLGVSNCAADGTQFDGTNGMGVSATVSMDSTRLFFLYRHTAQVER